MINVATIMKQVQDWLATDQNLADFTVERSAVVNENAGRAVSGWIGLYRKGVDYDPRHMGTASNNYEAVLEFMVFVQRSSMVSGEACEDILEESIKYTLDRMVALPKTYVDHFSDIIVDYTYLEDDSKTLFFQGALLTFTAEVSFEVN